MAITKTIEIDVNSQGAVGGINNVTNSIDQADKATQSLKSQLRQAQAEVAELSDKFGATSKEAVNAAKKAAELKDAIGDAKALTDAFNPDAKFNALTGSLAGVASGFGAIEGSLVLAGVESENLQKTMVQLQSAMALSQGLQGLGESIDSFKQLGAVAKNALAGIRTGIAATGIGVLLVALGAVVAYWDDIKEAVGGVSEEQENLNIQAQENLDVQQKKLDTIGSQDNILKLQGKSEKDILKIKLAQTDEVIKASEIQIQNNIATTKAQTEAARRNQEILAGTLKFLSLPLTMILKTVDLVGKALGKDFGLEEKVFTGLASFVFDPKEVQKEGDAAVAEQKKALDKLKNDRAGLQLSIKAIDKQAATDAAAKQKEANDKAIELEKQKVDALERIRQGEIDTEAERRAEEKRQIQKQYEELIAEATKYGQDTTALKEAQRTKEKELQDKFDAEDEEKRIAAEEKKKAEEQKQKDDEERLAKEREEIAQKEREFKEQQYRNTYDNLQNILSVGGGKLNKVAKALAIADVVRTATKSVSETVSSIGIANAKAVAASPLTGGMPFVAINTLKGALTIGSTIASSIKSIQAIKGESQSVSGSSAPSSGGSGGGGTTPAPAPQFNVVGNSGVNQIAQTLGAQQPVQAYVVANQVTTQQALDRNIVQNASLG